MNKKITAAEFHDAVERELSGLKPDLFLAKHVIAADKGEAGMKRKLSVGLIFAIALMLVLVTAACAVTGLYRVVTWDGKIKATKEPYPEMQPDDEAWMDSVLQSVAADYPENETVYLWMENKNHEDIERGLVRNAKKTFDSHEEFMRYMAGDRNLTLPVWLPEENVREYTAETTIECRAFGKYDRLEDAKKGHIQVNRFLIDESSRVNTEYSITLSLEDGSYYIIGAELREGLSEEALLLREGETAEKVTVKGMDEALLIRSREWPDWIGLIMQRKLDEPVRLKQLPYCELLEEENDDQYCNAEYVRVWMLDKNGRNDLIKVFSGE